MQDPFIGTWILNVQKSQFDANHRPQAGTIVVEVDSEGYYLQKAEGISEKGEKVTERPQRYLADGQDHPIPGMPGLSYRATRSDAKSIAARKRSSLRASISPTIAMASADFASDCLQPSPGSSDCAFRHSTVSRSMAHCSS